MSADSSQWADDANNYPGIFTAPPEPTMSSDQSSEPTENAPPMADPSQFVPPQPQQPFTPPGGRIYGQYRMPPTWLPDQAPHYMGAGDYFEQPLPRQAASIMSEALGGLAQVVGGAAVGYLLTADWAVAAGSGLAVAGLGQLPHVLGPGGPKRAALGGVCLLGAFLLLKNKSVVRFGKGKEASAPWMKRAE